jgi:NitT/TauT family transport system ATP-binding protein
VTETLLAAFVPLVDCAPLVVARERGFAAAEGLALELVKEPSWASLRDHLNLGHVDCAHALAPLPVASSLGVGHVRAECFVPFVLGRGGNAITVSTPLFAEMQRAARGALHTPAGAGAALAAAIRARAKPPTFGMVFPFSSHNFELRYWLAAAGVHPDRDLKLVAIPPPLMVESLRHGHVDGFCVGEPWNGVAAAEGIGRVVVTKSQLFPHGVEKVLAVRAALEHEPERLGPLLRALARAAQWCDEPDNRGELADLLARPQYVGAPAPLVSAALAGSLRLPGGAFAGEEFMYFHRGGANAPRREEALWLYAQMLRWGQLAPSEAREAAAARVFRPDVYERFVGAPSEAPPALEAFDGAAFDAVDVRGYVARFPIATRFTEPAAVES